jgi:hypothetical protein
MNFICNQKAGPAFFYLKRRNGRVQLHPNKWLLPAGMNKRGLVVSKSSIPVQPASDPAFMNSRDHNIKREENICIHIFSVSAGIVGVCLTVIGLIRVVITLGRADTLADDFPAGDAVLLLTAFPLVLQRFAVARHEKNSTAGAVGGLDLHFGDDGDGCDLRLHRLRHQHSTADQVIGPAAAVKNICRARSDKPSGNYR